MNTKNKDYKRYLKLSKELWYADFNSKRYHEIIRIFESNENMYGLYMSDQYHCPPKHYIKPRHKSDRLYNKQVLKYNVKTNFKVIYINDVDDDFDLEQWDDHLVHRWISEGVYFEEDKQNFRYHHRNDARWHYW